MMPMLASRTPSIWCGISWWRKCNAAASTTIMTLRRPTSGSPQRVAATSCCPKSAASDWCQPTMAVPWWTGNVPVDRLQRTATLWRLVNSQYHLFICNNSLQFTIQGCYEKLLDWVLHNRNIIIYVSVGIGVVQILLIFLSCCLSSSINKYRVMRL